MIMTRMITDQHGRSISISHISTISTIRYACNNPSRICFRVSIPSGLGMMMQVDIPNNAPLYVREKEKTIIVDKSWSTSVLVSHVLSAIGADPVGMNATVIYVAESPHSVYRGMVCL